MIQVIQTGATISFQDQGRTHPNSWLEFGVPPAGSIDPYSAKQANLLAHNLCNDTLLEVMLGGALIEVLNDCYLAHVGTLRCEALPPHCGGWFRAGSSIHFTPNKDGAWSYLAVTGGWAAAQQFGSSSYHQRSNVGQEIKAGDTIHVANPSPNLNKLPRRTPVADQRDHTSPPSIRIFPGPHRQLFSDQAWNALKDIPWRISARSDRSGYRLESESSPLQHSLSIHSTPTLTGSVQVLSTGQLITTLNDGPTVGGYPIIARIHPDDIGWLTQRHAHTQITFNHA
ncbi:biotin-dependent carboxyltransferase family protein [Rubritalea marina]|uniref:5-oxoprolinase subunit C family protein n=1 Tax=Rubritalea marina TaxID=361055 RepID=UPI00037E6587|nr:biotin-dependent carboxyltransferase family protein [Rubritalea marina]